MGRTQPAVRSIQAAARGAVRRLQERLGFDPNPGPAAEWELKYGGFVIAAIGFGLTRFTVLNAVHRQESFLAFLLADGFALSLGLGIILVGLALSVSAIPRRVVNTVATWCVVGTGGMAIVVGAVVFQAAMYGSVGTGLDIWINSILTTALLGGAVGGLLLGYRSVTAHQHRQELSLKIDQATLLNRIVRHEVLNKTNIIQGNAHSGLEGSDDPRERFETILRNASAIESAVDDIGFLLRTDRRQNLSLEPIDISDIVQEELATIRREYPEVDVQVDGPLPTDARVPGDKHLRSVFARLFAELAQRGDRADASLAVSVRADTRTVELEVRASGPALSDAERAILQNQSLPEYDSPAVGFGPSFLRLLVTQYGGDIHVPSDGDAASGVRVCLELPRVTDETRPQIAGTVTGVELRELRDTGIAALIAGIAMGLVLQGMTDILPAIGGLYGVQTVWAGWILHLFHSVVFGIAFSAVVSRPALHGLRTPTRCATLGVGYGLMLWLVAAGLIMPIWLNIVGIQAPIPRLTMPSLIGHLVWGAILGSLYGYFPRLYQSH